MSGQHKHGNGWVLGCEVDEDESPAMVRHAKRYGHPVTGVCRHHGRVFTREYCETCGRRV